MPEPKITMTIKNPDGLSKKDVADKLVEHELDAYDDWLMGTFKGTSRLMPFERALIKTYLMHKLEGEIEKIPS